MSRICAADSYANPDSALLCEQCGAKLSRLSEGDLAGDSEFSVVKRVQEQSQALLYLARDTQQRPFLISEYFPYQPGSALKKRFVAAVRLLKEAGAPIETHYTTNGPYYVVESMGGGRLLADDLSPRHAAKVLDGLCAYLKNFHLHPKQLFHGNITDHNVVRLSDGGVFLVGSAYPGWQVAEREADAAFLARQDLAAVGRLVQSMLLRKGEASKHAPPLELAVTAEYLVGQEGREAPSLEAAGELRELLRRAKSEPGQAADLYDRAFNLSAAPSLKPVLDELKSKQTKVKAAAATATGPMPDPVTAPEPAKPEPPKPEPPPAAPRKPVPEPLPVVAPSDEPAGTMFCAVHGAIPDLEANHCLNCGLPLKYYAFDEPLPRLQPSPPPRVPRTEGKPGKAKWFAAGAAAALIGFLIYYVSTAQDRAFNRALADGDFASEGPDSAYSIRESARAEGDLSRVRAMDQRAKPVLAARSDELFDRWYRESELTGATWRETLRLETWHFEIDPSNDVHARLLYAQGRVALDQNKFAEALNLFRQSLDARSDWALAWNGMGMTCLRLTARGQACFDGGARRNAEYFYLRARDADPNWPFAYQNLGNEYSRQYNFAESERMYRQAVSLDPNRPGSHFLLGRLLVARGSARRDEGCQELRSAVSLAKNRANPGFTLSEASSILAKSCP